jgi:thymidine kinase
VYLHTNGNILQQKLYKNIKIVMNIMDKGRIELIIGPMYAGKSTELIKIINRYKSIGKNVLVINHTINNRYNTNNISTHDSIVFNECINIDMLQYIKKKYIDLYEQSEIIIIEELQFFEDAFEFITNSADIDKKIIVAIGLNGDYNRKPFENITKLIPHADSITKLSALCKYCSDGTEAHFSKLIKNDNDNTNQILVGGIEKFEAVCRKHYITT